MACSRSGVQLSLAPPERKWMKKRVSKTLYEKRGKKYVAVGKDDFGLPYGVGDWLVRIRKGSSGIHCLRKNLTVDHARVEVMMADAEDALASAIVRVSELEPRTRPTTKREQEAWKAYRRIAGEEGELTFSRGSAQEMARKAVQILAKKLREKPCEEGAMEVFADRQV